MLWDVENGGKREIFRKEKQRFGRLAISPDGKTVHCVHGPDILVFEVKKSSAE